MTATQPLTTIKLFEAGPTTAMVGHTQSLSYQKLDETVMSISRFLITLGIRQYDRIAIVSSNSVEYILVLLALWRLGAVACLLSTRLPIKALNEQMDRILCRYCFTSMPHLLTPSQLSVKTLNLDTVAHQRLKNIELFSDEEWFLPLEREATILFTSGSTDQPKAVLHTFANHFFSAKGSNEHIPVSSQDRWLLSLPLYHVGGLSIIFRILLAKGTIVVPKPGSDLSEALKNKDWTHISLVSTQLQDLLQNQKNILLLKKCKAILLGGSAIPQSLIKESIRLGLPIYLSYGLTEMSSQVATSPKVSSLKQAKKLSVLEHREVRIADDGEILVRGGPRFKGYAKGNILIQPFDRVGWFHTGDLGQMHNNRELVVTGRKDNMFVSGGENIQPEEIERTLHQIKAVRRALVIPAKDGKFGFRPVALVEFLKGQEMRKKEITKLLLSQLPKFKIPKHFYVWPSQSKISPGKINRSKLQGLINSPNSNLKLLR